MNSTPDAFLHRLPVMTGLDDAALQFLGDLAEDERYPTGATIVAEGEKGNRAFFIEAGRVRMVKGQGSPQPVVLAEMGPGEFFGEISLVESVARTASAIALEPTRVCTLKSTDFYRLYRERPDQFGIVILNIARDLARRLRQLDERFAGVSH
jgi:CRP/FNR family transcriptional regulator, cyclic AMP receptor protein